MKRGTLKIEYIHGLLVFILTCLQINFLKHQVRNSKVIRIVLRWYGKPIDDLVDHYRLRYLGHVLHMAIHRLPRRAMMTGVEVVCRKNRGGQTKMWDQSLESVTIGLRHIGRWRPPDWGPCDYRSQCLKSE